MKKVYSLLAPFHSLVHSPQSEKTLNGDSLSTSDVKLPDDLALSQKIRDFISDALDSVETRSLHANFEAVFKYSPPQRSKSTVGLAEAIELAKGMDFSDTNKSPFDESLLGLAGSRLVYMDPKKSVLSRENTLLLSASSSSHKKSLSTASASSVKKSKSSGKTTSSSSPADPVKDIQSQLRDLEYQVKYLTQEKEVQEKQANAYGWLAVGTAVASLVYHEWNSPQSWLRSRLLGVSKR